MGTPTYANADIAKFFVNYYVETVENLTVCKYSEGAQIRPYPPSHSLYLCDGDTSTSCPRRASHLDSSHLISLSAYEGRHATDQTSKAGGGLNLRSPRFKTCPKSFTIYTRCCASTTSKLKKSHSRDFLQIESFKVVKCSRQRVVLFLRQGLRRKASRRLKDICRCISHLRGHVLLDNK